VAVYPHVPFVAEAVQGLRGELQAELPADSYELIERRAVGFGSEEWSAVEEAAHTHPAVVIPFGTALSLATNQRLPPGIPIVFLGVDDPVDAGLAGSLRTPGGRCTGVTGLIPVEQTFSLLRDLFPSARVVGLVHQPQYLPGMRLRAEALQVGAAMNLSTQDWPVEGAPDFRRIVASSDALLLLVDDPGLALRFVEAGLAVGKPVFSGEDADIRAGALGGYTLDPQEIGREGARQVVRILRGEAAGSLPIARPRGILEINRRTASQFGLSLSGDRFSGARFVSEHP
jgi:ABC-type uncharacterized transport system substrate-binding protein